MKKSLGFSVGRLRELITDPRFWSVLGMLGLGTLFHYGGQIRYLPLPLSDDSIFRARHAMDRVLFVLPIAYAAFSFGWVGGLITALTAVLVMLPRALLISAQPLNAIMEIMAIMLVAGLVSWMVERQEWEKRLRQKAVEELRTVNAIAVTVSQSLDLDEILDKTFGKVLEVTELEAKGGIFLLDVEEQKLHLRVHRGLSPQFVRREAEVAVGECLCGLVAESGEVLLADDSFEDARHTRCRELDPHSHIIVPLKSRDRVLGVMFLYLRGMYQPDAADKRLFASIGSQIGVAVENARLYENMRFYVRQITRAQEEERKRIARELHDETAQILVAFSRRLDALTSFPEPLPQSVKQRLEEFRELAASALQSVRRFSKDLRPPALDDLGLLAALEGLNPDIEKEGIEVELKVLGPRQRLSSEVELVLFRIVQEALNNVRRHSKASRVLVGVEFCESSVRVMVEDDGRGFQVPDRVVDLVATGKLGLIGMHERARLLGGTLTVESKLGKGTTVIADLRV